MMLAVLNVILCTIGGWAVGKWIANWGRGSNDN